MGMLVLDHAITLINAQFFARDCKESFKISKNTETNQSAITVFLQKIQRLGNCYVNLEG